MLVWDELKAHIHPSEVDNYARRIGLARISRNEEVYSELTLLRQMESTIQANLTNEIEKKNPIVLASAQRSAAINRAITFLDSLRDQGHFVDPTNPNDSQVLKYLKFTRTARPATAQRPFTVNEVRRTRSARSVDDVAESIEGIQSLIDEEYSALTAEIHELRSAMFANCEELQEVKAIEPPTTAAIETFNKRLKTKDFVCRSIANTRGSGPSRLRDSVRLSRLWD
jgi:hypothetical protein